MNRFRNKYRSDSIRLRGYDYSSEGLYFLTICTEYHRSFFGKVEEGMMQLNTIGKIVAREWKTTEEIRDNVQLGEWVIMPNHVHGIVWLKNSTTNGRDASNASPWDASRPLMDIDTDGNTDLDSDGRSPSLPFNTGYKNKFGPQSNNISSIVRGFKAASSRKIKAAQFDNFRWQSGFYDHIIRNQESLTKIEQYIRENPYRWAKDRYYC